MEGDSWLMVQWIIGSAENIVHCFDNMYWNNVLA